MYNILKNHHTFVCAIMCASNGCTFVCNVLNRAQERINQHLNNKSRKVETCPVHKHSLIYHRGKKFSIRYKILKNSVGDPITRQITDAVLILSLIQRMDT